MLFGVVPLEEEFITKSHFGTVGLGFLSEDQDESFLHQLVNLNYIDYKVFYIKFMMIKKDISHLVIIRLINLLIINSNIELVIFY